MEMLFRDGRDAFGRCKDMLVRDGKIVAFGKPGEFDELATSSTSLAGDLLLPPFVDGHLHLDKTFLGDAWRPHRSGLDGFDVRERVQIEQEELAGASGVRVRAEALVRKAVGNGTLHIRSHVDVDNVVRLGMLEGILDIREQYGAIASIQIIAFPQSGILTNPGTIELLEEALKSGADGIGGIDPKGIDGDVEGQLDVVFGLAERYGVPIDIHLHDRGEAGLAQIHDIADRALALDMQNMVAISHAYSLGEISTSDLDMVARKLEKAGVSIMTNGPGIHSMPPVTALKSRGVTVFSGSDNVRDSWWPYGDADMLHRAMLVGYRAGLFTDEELGFALDMITVNGAKVLGIMDYGLTVGHPANFIAVSANCLGEAIVSHPHTRRVFQNGELIASGLKCLF